MPWYRRHNLIVLSDEAEAICWPSGEKQQQGTLFSWPDNVRSAAPSLARRNLIVLSAEAAIIQTIEHEFVRWHNAFQVPYIALAIAHM